MPSVKPQGEALKKAVLWIGQKRKEDPDASAVKLADEASFRFDLSPKDSAFLLRLVREEDKA